MTPLTINAAPSAPIIIRIITDTASPIHTLFERRIPITDIKNLPE
jgi:hypothetical protein